MKSLSELPAKKIRGIFSDLDDTMTQKGKLPSEVVRALEELKAKNYWVAIVSGRPAGWADCLMRLLPIDAMIFENGAGMMTREKEIIKTTLLAKDLDFAGQRKILESTFRELKKKIPHAKLATDQPYRLCDYAVDFAEEPPFLSEAETQTALELLSTHPKLTAKLSSIHINYWYGTHTKVSACEELIRQFGNGMTKEEIVFSGDSPNDEPLFAYFPNSVGVANISRFLDRLKTKPTYLTTREGGAGFVEMVQFVARR